MIILILLVLATPNLHHGSISPQKNKTSDIWWVFIHHNGQRKSIKVGPKKAAEESIRHALAGKKLGIFKEEKSLSMVRNYRDRAELDTDTLREIQTWINDMEIFKPGFSGWFRIEFQSRFPEFDNWKLRQQKKRAGNDY